MSTVIIRFINRLVDRHPSHAIERFADLFGRSLARSNGVMLERATVPCHTYDHRTML